LEAEKPKRKKEGQKKDAFVHTRSKIEGGIGAARGKKPRIWCLNRGRGGKKIQDTRGRKVGKS